LNGIKIITGNLESEYVLEEKESGILVKAPYLEHGDNGEKIISHSEVEIQNGDKADMIRQFFIESKFCIIRSGAAYVIDEILFDECPLPARIEPEEITD
jgi:hypothetical protein